MRPKLSRATKAAAALALLAVGTPSLAQFNPARVVREPAAVAARFPDPDVRYATPAFREGRTDFPSHGEVLAFLDDQARKTGRVRVLTLGASQDGRPMVMAVMALGGAPNPALPTVMILGQQHGNEPAGGEAALAIVAELAGPRSALLERVNVLVVPRANPDGAERFARTTTNGIDVNRDHLLLRTPEARAIAAGAARWRPQVLLDLHEFTVAGRWVDKFGAMQKYDALLQPATVGNLEPSIDALARDAYEARLHQALARQGLVSFAYHTTSPDPKDPVVSMGGVQPDTGRNTGGLRPAVSLLIEVRGIGLGRAHLLRRVHTQVVAAMETIEAAAGQGRTLIDGVQRAGAETAARACQGELVIAARHTRTTQPMVFVDAVTGADKPISADWRAASPLDVQRTRPRPCGYLVAADQRGAVDRLRLLGVTVQPVVQAARWAVERYRIVNEGGGQRQDARGAIDDGGEAAIRVLDVQTVPSNDVVAPGTFYIGLDQPMGALVAAALEPDSQSSYAANRLLAIEDTRLLRVTARPAKGWIAAP